MSTYVGFKISRAKEHKAYISEYYCGRCGYPVSDHDSYCPECGGAFREKDATERTCNMELIKSGPIYSVWRFSCCGYEHSENDTDRGATGIPGTRCPKCGAKVVN